MEIPLGFGYGQGFDQHRHQSQGQVRGLQKLKNVFLENRVPSYISPEKYLSFQKWSVGFAYIISLIGPLLDVTNFIDLFVEDVNTIIIVHVVRIIISLVIFILAVISMANGWKNADVNIKYNIFTKILSLLLSLSYLITLSVKVGIKDQKETTDYISIGGSVIITIVNIIFLGLVIKEYNEHKTSTSISWIFIIITAVISIIFSLVIMYNKTKNTDVNLPPPPTIQT